MSSSSEARKAASGCLAALIALALVNVATASTQYFTNVGDFKKQLTSPYYEEDFFECQGLSTPVWTLPVTYPNHGPPVDHDPSPGDNGYKFAMTADSAGYGLDPQTVAGAVGGWSTFTAGTMTVTYAPPQGGTVTAVGGYFFPDDYDGNLATGVMTVSVYDGTALLMTAPNYTPTALKQSFIGFISTDPITSLTATAAGGPQTCTAIGDVYVGVGTYVPPTLPGDANLDGKVDINDLNVVLTHYDQSGMVWATGDFNGDQKVDINDLSTVLINYDRSASAAGAAAAVPEPSSIALLAGIGGLLVYAWRTRKG